MYPHYAHMQQSYSWHNGPTMPFSYDHTYMWPQYLKYPIQCHLTELVKQQLGLYADVCLILNKMLAYLAWKLEMI